MGTLQYTRDSVEIVCSIKFMQFKLPAELPAEFILKQQASSN